MAAAAATRAAARAARMARSLAAAHRLPVSPGDCPECPPARTCPRCPCQTRRAACRRQRWCACPWVLQVVGLDVFPHLLDGLAGARGRCQSRRPGLRLGPCLRRVCAVPLAAAVFAGGGFLWQQQVLRFFAAFVLPAISSSCFVAAPRGGNLEGANSEVDLCPPPVPRQVRLEGRGGCACSQTCRAGRFAWPAALVICSRPTGCCRMILPP